MPDAPKSTPKSAPRSAGEIRRERQAAALRENLRKRKQQARERRDGEEADGAPDPRDDAEDR